MAKKQKPSQNKEYHALQERIRNLKNTANNLTKKYNENPEGRIKIIREDGKEVHVKFNTARTYVLNKIVNLNDELILLSEVLGIKNREQEATTRTKPEYNVSEATKTYIETVWEAESRLKDWLSLGKKGMFQTFLIVNNLSEFNISEQSSILTAFDLALNQAYLARNASTPFCEITEYSNEGKVSFEILS